MGVLDSFLLSARSVQQRAVQQAIRAALTIGFKQAGALPLPLTLLRKAMDQGAALFPVRLDVKAERIACDAASAVLLTPQVTKARAILHLHGGAFFAGSAKTHQSLCAEIAHRAECPVLLVEYRLAPEHAYPAPLDDALSAWRLLLDRGFRPEQITVAGDSAGGALALSLVQRLKQQGDALPGALVLMSPYLDLTLSRFSLKALAGKDPMLSKAPLQRGGDAYRGAYAATDPCVSPLFGDLSGLPPTLVQVGSDEILLDDALAFASKSTSLGNEVKCQVVPEMWHNFQLFYDRLDVADQALDDLALFIRAHGAS